MRCRSSLANLFDRLASCRLRSTVRPAIVLYEEGFSEETTTAAINAVANAQLVVVVGTSLQVYPFAGLLQYQNSQNCLIINQTMLEQNTTPQVLASGETVFAKLSH